MPRLKNTRDLLPVNANDVETKAADYEPCAKVTAALHLRVGGVMKRLSYAYVMRHEGECSLFTRIGVK